MLFNLTTHVLANSSKLTYIGRILKDSAVLIDKHII